MKIKFTKYTDLTNKEIWEIYKTRSEVFVVEQEWLSCEIDENDLNAIHMTIRNDEDELVAYLRIFEIEGHVTLGRVLVPMKFRKLKLGKLLVGNAVEYIKENYKNLDLIIHAQHRLLEFYKSFGFIPTSEVYDDDGIDHIEMTIYK